MPERPGVLPRQTLRQVFESGYITSKDAKFNPASIDLPLSSEAYRLEKIFLPKPGDKVRDLFEAVGATPHDLKLPLEVKVPYLIRIDASIELPVSVYGYANPKSSTGRINLFSRLVADHVNMYDALRPEGWTGDVWVLVRADSFPVLLTPGQSVTQLRLFDGKTFLSSLELDLAIKKHGLLFKPDGSRMPAKEIMDHTDSLFVTLGVTEGLIGWECRGTGKVLDFGKIKHYKASDFFSPVYANNGTIQLRKDSFYILTTHERVLVPPELSAELRAIDPRFGEFRAHAAGYIDPGWGWGKSGEARDRPITLEVIPHEDVFIADQQAVAKIRYEHMKMAPDRHYDDDEVMSNYTGQSAARLSKHFVT